MLLSHKARSRHEFPKIFWNIILVLRHSGISHWSLQGSASSSLHFLFLRLGNLYGLPITQVWLSATCIGIKKQHHTWAACVCLCRASPTHCTHCVKHFLNLMYPHGEHELVAAGLCTSCSTNVNSHMWMSSPVRSSLFPVHQWPQMKNDELRMRELGGFQSLC